MSTDLTKMVRDYFHRRVIHDLRKDNDYDLIKTMAAEIEANGDKVHQVDQQSIGMNAARKSDIEQLEEQIESNRKEIEKLKADLENQTDRYDDSVGV